MTITAEMTRNDLIQLMKDLHVKGWYRIYNKADMVKAIEAIKGVKEKFVQVEKAKGQAIEVGMGACGTYWTDYTPFEVVRIVSDKTVEIRELEVEIVGGDWLDPVYELYKTNRPVQKVRKCKSGWRTSDGMRIYFGNARYYRDPSF